MTYGEFLHMVQEESRFKTSQNVMDRDIKVTIRNDGSYEDVEILAFEIDSKGDICIIVDEPERDDEA
jgi:hypothetical protein